MEAEINILLLILESLFFVSKIFDNYSLVFKILPKLPGQVEQLIPSPAIFALAITKNKISIADLGKIKIGITQATGSHVCLPDKNTLAGYLITGLFLQGKCLNAKPSVGLRKCVVCII